MRARNRLNHCIHEVWELSGAERDVLAEREMGGTTASRAGHGRAWQGMAWQGMAGHGRGMQTWQKGLQKNASVCAAWGKTAFKVLYL